MSPLKPATSNYVDVWTMGYTPFVVVGVWAGNNDNSPINKQTGIGLAAPIWRAVIQEVIAKHPVENFTAPEAKPITNPILIGQYSDQGNHSILYYINKDEPTGPGLQNPTTDSQYQNWEAGVQTWLVGHPSYIFTTPQVVEPPQTDQ